MKSKLVTETTILQITSQPVERHGNLMDSASRQTQQAPQRKGDHLPSPLNPTTSNCQSSAQSPACWSFDTHVAVLLVILSGLLILALLYKVLLLRHKLRMAQARNALEYFSFCHTGHYNLKDPGPPSQSSAATSLDTVSPPDLSASSVTLKLPPPVVPSPPAILPPLPPPPPPPPPPAQPIPHPLIYTTPPSPHPSCGAGSDVEVYSRIGSLRLSRLSSVSQTQVILFEHSSL